MVRNLGGTQDIARGRAALMAAQKLGAAEAAGDLAALQQALAARPPMQPASQQAAPAPAA